MTTANPLAGRLLRGPVLLLGMLALSLAAACAGGTDTASSGSAEEPSRGAGKSADFRLATLDGRQLGPPDLADQVVLVDFWATWCVPCHAQADILKELYPEAREDGVEFLAVDVGEDRGLVEEFVASRPFPYPVLLDPDSRVADSFAIYSLPTLMIVDRQGRISYLSEGIHDAEEIRELLAKAAES